MFVVVGVSGGIAAYKAVHLVRLFVTAGHDVHVVPTADALRFVGLPTWEAISRNAVTTSVHEGVSTVRHVSLGQRADLVVVAPATANTIATMAAGLADDLLGTTLLATSAPVVIAPAMHTEMWQHPATQHNVAVLRARGVHTVGPDDGALTGTDSGPGRMAEPEAIYEAAVAAAQAQPQSARGGGPATSAHDLAGLRLLVTAGGTREPIDPVRFIGNRSSGRQGTAIAIAAAERGASVDLVLAHVDEGVALEASAHPRIAVHRAETAAELEAVTAGLAPAADAIVMAAAVADYRVAQVSQHKLRKEDGEGAGLSLELVPNADIVAGLARARDADPARARQRIVGFAAETVEGDDELLDRARRKRARKGIDLLVANAVGWQQGFERAENEVVIVDAEGRAIARAHGPKPVVADAVLDALRDALRGDGRE